eukprot:m.48054 g.48054  ORF g.48054 m.48054 type:complete len:346 (-) comp13264_c0_seq1:194-1231(-)
MAPPLVLDLGSSLIRLGHAGFSHPKHVIATRSAATDAYVYENDSQLSIEAYSTALEHALTATNTKLSHQPLCLVHSVACTDTDRENLAELAFETHRTPTLYLGTDSVTALYSIGRVSGIVVDIGLRHTRTVAVHDGFALPSSLQIDNVGGNHVTQFLQTALSERGHKLSEATCEALKLKHARCALQYGPETRQARDLPLRKNVVTLPDGTLVDMTDDLIRCAEVIIRPSFAGVGSQGLVAGVDAVMRTCHDRDQSLELRNVPGFVLAVGGSSRIANLGARLQRDVDDLQRSVGGCVVSCLTEEERQHAAWIGGSLVSCLPDFFEEQGVTAQDYAEIGKAVVLDRC